MLQKDYVNAFLVTHFDRIQKARQLNGFSWKPIVQEILTLHPDIDLDPNNEAHRDRVRNNFLNIRKRNASPTLVNRFPTARIVESVPCNNTSQTVTIPLNLLVEAAKADKFQYLDTYNTQVKVPETEQEEFAVWKKEKDKLKNQRGMHIVIGCVHLPAVNRPFFNAFLSFLSDARSVLKGIHLIGDILDCKSLSQHDNGQISDVTLDEEYAEANKDLDSIDELLEPGVEKNYLWGNHEQRYERILKKIDISKFGSALISPTAGCKFIERGYTVQEDYKNGKIQLGKYLDLVHGEYITQNSAKKHLDVYKKSIMFAHTHRMSAFYDCDKASFNIGWMGDKEHNAFGYVSRITKSQWQNGFAVVSIDDHGFYHVQLVQWYNGRFVFGTREYNGK